MISTKDYSSSSQSQLGIDHARHSELIIRNLTPERVGFQMNFEMRLLPGQWISLLGPSGAGKSTALSMIAGFTQAATGSISMGLTELSSTSPHLRPFSYVFQSNALFPFLTIEKNLLLAFSSSKIDNKSKKTRIAECFDAIKLPIHYLKKLPAELSGGELSRANVGRALLQDKPIMLLDEPFAALDEPLRKEMNLLLLNLKMIRGLSLVVVTHHQMDAWLFADQTLLLMNGLVVAQGTSRELFDNPDLSDSACAFLGSKVNLKDSNGVSHFMAISKLSCISKQKSFPLHNAKILWTPQGNMIQDTAGETLFPLPGDGPFTGYLFAE